MPWTPLTSRADIAVAFGAVSSNWKAGARRVVRDISWRPATQTFDVWWRPQEAAWAVLELRPHETHHWIFVGLDIERNPLNIDCQFDPSSSGFTRRHGGVFLGVPGVGRNAFIAYGGGRTVSIGWPDGKVTDGFAICDVQSSTLPAALKEFTELKLQFRDSVT